MKEIQRRFGLSGNRILHRNPNKCSGKPVKYFKGWDGPVKRGPIHSRLPAGKSGSGSWTSIVRRHLKRNYEQTVNRVWRDWYAKKYLQYKHMRG